MKNLLAVLLIAASISPSAVAQDTEEYFAIAIPGSWQDSKRGFSTRIMHYPGYARCNKEKKIDFLDRAKRELAKDMREHHSQQFPNTNIVNNLRKVASSSDSDIAYKELVAWDKAERANGYALQYNDYSIRCRN